MLESPSGSQTWHLKISHIMMYVYIYIIIIIIICASLNWNFHCQLSPLAWLKPSKVSQGRFHAVLHGHGEEPTEGVEPQRSFSGRITEAHPTWMGHGEIVSYWSSSSEICPECPEKGAYKFTMGYIMLYS